MALVMEIGESLLDELEAGHVPLGRARRSGGSQAGDRVVVNGRAVPVGGYVGGFYCPDEGTCRGRTWAPATRLPLRVVSL
jgi:hypothetical protein